MNEQIKYLVLKLEETFNGSPWYGKSLMKKLNAIDYQMVNITTPQITNSVAKLVLHTINWRIYVIEKLQGNTEFDIQIDSSADWEEVCIESEMDWKKLLKKLAQTQLSIVEILLTKTDSFLNNIVSGRSHNFKFLIDRIIQHDIYHLGQIGLVAKLKSIK